MRPRARIAASAVVALVVGAGALWLAGGLRAADTPPPVRPGRDIDQQMFRTRVTGAHIGVIKKTKFTPERRLLVINAWVTNLTDQTQGTSGPDSDDAVFGHGLFLYWNTGNGPRPAYTDCQALAGNTLFRSLQPRMPTYVAVQYQLTDKDVVPDHIKIALAKYQQTAAGILDPRGYWDWQPRAFHRRVERDPFTHKSGQVSEIIPELVATVTLPVKR